MKNVIVVMICFFNFQITLYAADAGLVQDKSRGCGVGQLVAPKKTLVSTTTAQAVDFFSFPSTWFAVTSGTSGCDRHSIVMQDKMQQHFVEANLESLKFELALGSGEHLNIVGRMLGCSNDELASVEAMLRKEYVKIFKSQNANEVLELIRKTTHGNCAFES